MRRGARAAARSRRRSRGHDRPARARRTRPAPSRSRSPRRPAPPRLTESIVVARFLDEPEGRRAGSTATRRTRRPRRRSTAATRRWTVKVWSGKAGEIALGKVEDGDGRVSEAWTGPQVAWSMARGRVGSFGGKVLNAWWMWIPLSVVFFLGLVDRRRLRSWHTLDLLALLSFGFSLWFFNRGEVFQSASLGAIPARLPARAHVVDRVPRPRLQPRALLAGLAARGRRRLPRRPPDRPQPRDARAA